MLLFIVVVGGGGLVVSLLLLPTTMMSLSVLLLSQSCFCHTLESLSVRPSAAMNAKGVCHLLPSEL